MKNKKTALDIPDYPQCEPPIIGHQTVFNYNVSIEGVSRNNFSPSCVMIHLRSLGYISLEEGQAARLAEEIIKALAVSHSDAAKCRWPK